MTWGTNIFGMKLGCFTTIGSDGQTIILAACIVLREDLPSFEWAFGHFAEVFKYEPEVIITDGDVAMALAIKTVFPAPRTRHNICIYHLSLNFNSHIATLFAGNNEGWHRVLNTFWRVAKETDERSRKSFGADFDQLVALVEASPISGGQKKAKGLAWLEKLRSRSEQWAYRFTWRYRTLGADSSQVCLLACLLYSRVLGKAHTRAALTCPQFAHPACRSRVLRSARRPCTPRLSA